MSLQRSLTVFLMAAAGFACSSSSDDSTAPQPAYARASVSETTVDTVVFNGCTGEFVALQGTTRVVFGTTNNTQGSHLTFHLGSRLTGIGQTSGINYLSLENSEFTANTGTLPFEQTSVSSLRFLAPGAADDLTVHVLQHITVDGQGTLRAWHDEFRATCD